MDVGGVEIPKSIADLPATKPRWISTPMKRVEDPLLLTGRAEMIDDVELPGMLHCAILRSPHAHAAIKSIDVSEAEKVLGVAAIITGHDAQVWPVPNAHIAFCLPLDKVRYVGQPVAAVAASNRYVAEDAVERIKVEYEPLTVVADAYAATQPGAPVIFEQLPENIVWQKAFTWGDVDQAFQEADQVFSEKFHWHRTSGHPIETGGCIGQWEPVEETVTIRGPIQMPAWRESMAAPFGLPANKVRAIGHWHGASFGSKGGPHGPMLTTLLSRKLGGRPVKYIEDRMEHLVGGLTQSWERYYEASIAVKSDGRVTGLKVKLLEDGGASPMGGSPAIAELKPLACFTGCYTIPVASYEMKLVVTNRAPGALYRGAGPPPHYVMLESMMDIAARGLGMDPAEIRRKNFIPPDKFPYIIPSGNEYDSGEYEKTLDTVLQMADYRSLRREQEEARKQGRYLGIGIVSTIEPGGPSWNVVGQAGFIPGNMFMEGATLAFDMLGKLTVRVGFPHQGQGQYTFVTQILADYFALEPSDIRVVGLDSLSSAQGYGPGGSRMAVVLTGAVLGAAERLKAKFTKVAAKLMEASPHDVEMMDGKFRIKGVPGAELTLQQVLGAMLTRVEFLPADVDPNPQETYVYTTPNRDMPDEQGRCKSYLTAANAVHLALIELDPDTGKVDVLKYYIADDCGTRLNPATVEGMIQGGMAQGLGAALLEEYVYDDQAQMLSSTYMDYLLPTIHEVPMTEKATLVTPSPFTGLGAKGTGEGAIHTAPAAILCAVNDALLPFGVRATETPATPLRVWNLIQQGRG